MAETKRLTASERDALLRMNVAAEILIEDIRELDARAALVPFARRDMAMLAAVARRLLKGFGATIPEGQIRTYWNALNMTSYVVGIKKPGAMTGDEKNFGLWVPFEALNLMMAACHDHCLMCPGDKGQRRACPLRRALDMIPNDTEEREDGDCPYYTQI